MGRQVCGVFSGHSIFKSEAIVELQHRIQQAPTLRSLERATAIDEDTMFGYLIKGTHNRRGNDRRFYFLQVRSLGLPVHPQLKVPHSRARGSGTLGRVPFRTTFCTSTRTKKRRSRTRQHRVRPFSCVGATS